MDSGASHHMTPYYQDFLNLEDSHVGGIKTADNTCLTVAAKGRVQFYLPNGCVLEITNVQWVPELSGPLLSVGALNKGGVQSVLGDDVDSSFLAPKGRLQYKIAHIHPVPSGGDGLLYEFRYKTVKTSSYPQVPTLDNNIHDSLQVLATAAAAKASDTNSTRATWWRWHQRLTHVSRGVLEKLFQPGVIRGATVQGQKCDLNDCVCCVMAKLVASPYRISRTLRRTQLGLIHMDIMGPMDVRSRMGHHYALVLVDDCTRHVWVMFLTRKGDAEREIRNWFKQVERQYERMVKGLRSDRGGEFLGNDFRQWLTGQGILHQLTCSYSPEQNGVAERMNRELAEKTRCILLQADLPKKFWEHAMGYVAWVKNRVVNTANKTQTPVELLSGEKPSLALARVFGCMAQVSIPKERRTGKLDARTRWALFLGVSPTSKGWIFQYLDTNTQGESCQAFFHEELFLRKWVTTGDIPGARESMAPTGETGDPFTSVYNLPAMEDGEVAPPTDLSVEKELDQVLVPPTGMHGKRFDLGCYDISGKRLEAIPEENEEEEIPSISAPKIPAQVSFSQNGVQGETESVGGAEQGQNTEQPQGAGLPLEVAELLQENPEDATEAAPEERLRESTGEVPVEPPLSSEAPTTSPGLRRPLSKRPKFKSKVYCPTVGGYVSKGLVAKCGAAHCSTLEEENLPGVFYPGEGRWGLAAHVERFYLEEECGSAKMATGSRESLPEPPVGPPPANYKVPVTYQQTQKCRYAKKWDEACEKEIEQFKDREVYQLVHPPPGAVIMGCKWVFVAKTGVDGSFEKFKARACVQGFKSIPGITHLETFAPTPSLTSTRALLAVTTAADWECDHMDVTGAFLYGELSEDVYVKPPPGYEEPDGRIWKLDKSLYGLKQAPRKWNEKLHGALTKHGFVQSKVEAALYTLTVGDSVLYLLAFVDDMLIASPDKELVRRTKEYLLSKFDMTDLGPVKKYLGWHIQRDRINRRMWLSLEKKINSTIQAFKLENAKPTVTPLPAGFQALLAHEVDATNPERRPEFEEDQYSELLGKADHQVYRQGVGFIQYAAQSLRPDVAWAANVLASVQHQPRERHLKGMFHCLKYLKGTAHLALHFDAAKGIHLLGYSDSDFAGCQGTRRSTSGCVVLTAGGPAQWRARKQPCITCSTTEAEYVALNLIVKEVMYLRSLFEEFGFPPTGPTPIFCDNMATVAISKDPVCSSRTRHVSTYFHWVREQQNKGLIQVISISTKEQAADYLTKMLPTAEFQANCALVGQVLLIPAPAAAPKEGECYEVQGVAASVRAVLNHSGKLIGLRQLGRTPTGSRLLGRTTLALRGSFGHNRRTVLSTVRPGFSLNRCAVASIRRRTGLQSSPDHRADIGWTGDQDWEEQAE